MTHDHRKLAIEFNQRCWELLDNKGRSPAEAEEMIAAAWASLAHWLKAGTGVHWQRGEWLIARVYAELARAEPALHHLRRTQELTDRYRPELADFDFAFLEALAARVHALANDRAAGQRHYAKAVSLGDKLSDPEDRKLFFDQLAEGPWFGFAP